MHTLVYRRIGSTCLSGIEMDLGGHRSSRKGAKLSSCIADNTSFSRGSLLAADLLPRLVYIPSGANPADRPSRGFRNRPARKSHEKGRSVAQLNCHLRHIIETARIAKHWVESKASRYSSFSVSSLTLSQRIPGMQRAIPLS